jgi:drug/metabolite transporter (DMT)-like permease
VSPPGRRVDAAAIVLVVALCAVWGLSQTVLKVISAEIPPLLQSGIRSAGAGALVLGWALATGERLFERDGTLVQGLACGLLFAFEFVALFHSVRLGSASHTVVFLYMAPFFVALGTHLLVPGERLDRRQLAGLVTAFAGIAVASLDALGLADAGELAGDALALLAAFFWGATTVLVKAGRLARINPSKTLFYQLSVASLLLPVLSLATGESWAIRPSLLVLLGMGFQIVVISWLSYRAWLMLVRHYPAGRLSAFTFLTPLFGMLAGGVLLHERISTRFGLAVLFVSAGIYLVNRSPPHRGVADEATVPAG